MRPYAVALSCLILTACDPEIIGQARVVDGDTIEITGQRIRLHGIDAPEAGQTCTLQNATYKCGQEATDALRAMIGDSQVKCREIDRDRYSRIVAKCRVGDTDINDRMVRLGHALAYRQYSTDYIASEEAARGARVGMHQGNYTAPSQYRQAKR